MKYRKAMTALAVSILACGSAGCSTGRSEDKSSTDNSSAELSVTPASLSGIDPAKWFYNKEDDVWYQTGIAYCSAPADASWETLAVFVPGAYMSGTENGDDTYTCIVTAENEVNGYTAATAPIVMPVNTPGYSAQAPLTASSSSAAQYTAAGFVYVHAGCRGRETGAPAGVTDLKAAIRYVRYTDETIPGDAESIFTFGMSGGGAQSAVIGASGDSAMYDSYLKAIGAAEGVSDAVLGSMCW